MYNARNGTLARIQLRCPAIKDGRLCNARIADISLTGDAVVYIRCPKCKSNSTIRVVQPPSADVTNTIE